MHDIMQMGYSLLKKKWCRAKFTLLWLCTLQCFLPRN